ncbi:hypothetical protein [Sphingomonas sp. ID0503]|uniref:hypothetical protein n=1 Tax=Sphingomonas sp. ID0503 TaxID=3399691 RepID=UPI003AFB33C7
MSRSRKKTPVIGYTTAESDKEWKQRASRRQRRATRQSLHDKVDGDATPQKRWSLTNPWSSDKDGKQWLAEPEARWLRK